MRYEGSRPATKKEIVDHCVTLYEIKNSLEYEARSLEPVVGIYQNVYFDLMNAAHEVESVTAQLRCPAEKHAEKWQKSAWDVRRRMR